MKVKEIPFIGRRRPAKLKKLSNLSNLGWSGPIMLPVPIRFNGVLCTHCVVSSYGAIRLVQASNSIGKWYYWNTDKVLPMDLNDTEKGWMVIPWGEPLKVTGCGVGIYMYEQDGNVIFDYVAKSTYDKNKRFLFRVEFSATKPNIVRIYYYHCETGYDTYLGIIKAPDDTIDWPLKENQPYMKKALEFDTSADEVNERPTVPAEKPTELPKAGYEWIMYHTPFGDQWKQQKIEAIITSPNITIPPGEIDWSDVATWHEGNVIYRVQKI